MDLEAHKQNIRSDRKDPTAIILSVIVIVFLFCAAWLVASPNGVRFGNRAFTISVVRAPRSEFTVSSGPIAVARGGDVGWCVADLFLLRMGRWSLVFSHEVRGLHQMAPALPANDTELGDRRYLKNVHSHL